VFGSVCARRLKPRHAHKPHTNLLHICMYVCMYVYIYTYMYVCVYIYVYIPLSLLFVAASFAGIRRFRAQHRTLRGCLWSAAPSKRFLYSRICCKGASTGCVTKIDDVTNIEIDERADLSLAVLPEGGSRRKRLT
jgi:hypothetical protein